MQSMLNEFYNYIAKNAVSFFQGRKDSLRPGERYCLKLDTDDMVSGVNWALRKYTELNRIQGKYEYQNVYSTFTIQISGDIEIVVASKMNGMTDDFLATLRNTELTEKRFPILIITQSTIDSISSGTGDLSANGMPFNATSIIHKIKDDISDAQLSLVDRTLLELELQRKQADRFSDKSSLFEYSDLLTVLGRGFVKNDDYPVFSLVWDPECRMLGDASKVKERLQQNHSYFEQINRTFRHGDIEATLEKEYDNGFIRHLVECKKKNISWYENYTFEMIKASRDKLKRKLDNPLLIEDKDFDIYSGSPLEYSFPFDNMAFMRDDGESNVRKRKKNIIIYNPEGRNEITVSIKTNVVVKTSCIEALGATATSVGREIKIVIKPSGCTFSRTSISDINNNIDYLIRVCVIDTRPSYLESIQTSYTLYIPRNVKRSNIQIFGVKKELIINPGKEKNICVSIENGKTFDCSYDQTLLIVIGEDDIDTDVGHMDCNLKCGSIIIPIRIQDEPVKPVELTGVATFKLKHLRKNCLEYRNEKIVSGTKEYYTKEPFRSSLAKEELFVKNSWLAICEAIDGYKEYKISVPNNVRIAYINLIEELRKKRCLPSLAYYADELLQLANAYVRAVEETFSRFQAGATLTQEQNNVLLLGCIIKNCDERTIAMGPLHPLNVLYQLTLVEEENVGSVRDDLVEKLSSLYLLPYIRDIDKNLYHAIDQKHSPEWNMYAKITNKRYQGARSFVQKLVCDKILQYKSHFSFLFDDIGNKKFHINLVNMGDCREILQGLIKYYAKSLKESVEPENLLHFKVNIYADNKTYNEFSVLSNQNKLKAYLQQYCGNDVENISEMSLILSGNIRCYYRNLLEAEYQYAHLTFYEMAISEETGTGRIDSIKTGISLGGLTSGIPSVLNQDWYKTGFGMEHAPSNRLTKLAVHYNALSLIAFSGSSYEPHSCIFTEIEKGHEGLLGKIYRCSNWVVFVDPKVDLSFFQKQVANEDELMIIHYSDQYTSASGYDDITVTQKSEQYNQIIFEQLQKKGVTADRSNINDIISLFNAINGGWMLRLISARKLSGAADSNFSREKMSILSAIKLSMAYYLHPDIIWIPISLEEMLRVSGGAGLSQNEGLLSAKNLGFERGPASDDILLVGIEGPVDQLKIYLHPIEVKIGQNLPTVITKAKEQIVNTYNSLWNALWPAESRDSIECKLSRNFFVQLVLICCEKMKLYNIYPDEQWDLVICDYRKALLNEQYSFDSSLDSIIGKGTIISFKSDVLNMSGKMENGVCILEFPEKLGSAYMVRSARMIENELDLSKADLPRRLKYEHKPYNEEHYEHGEKSVKIPVQHEKPVLDTNNWIDNVDIESSEDVLETPIPQNKEVGNEVVQDSLGVADDTEERIGMKVLFGTDVSIGQPLYWMPNDTNQVFHTNTGIIGTMGTGKTQFTKSLITQLYREQVFNVENELLGILIFDYKGDYNESKEDFIKATDAKVLKPYHLPFNPLALTKSKVFKPLLPIHTANAFKDTLSKVYGLGPKQQNSLFQCIIDAYAQKGIIPGDPNTWDNTPPTFDMIYTLYSNNEDIKKTDSLAAAMDKLYQFQVFEGNPSLTLSLFELLKGVIVIDLSGYDSDIQSLIVAITLDLFYAQMQAAGSSKLSGHYRQITKLILVDEADNFMCEGFPSLKRILKEGREFGVGTILSTQFLKHFGTGDDDYAKYILTWVVHNVADLKGSDVEFVFKTEPKSTETNTLFNDIKELKKHNSVVKIGNTRPKYIEDKAFWELYRDLKLN